MFQTRPSIPDLMKVCTVISQMINSGGGWMDGCHLMLLPALY